MPMTAAAKGIIHAPSSKQPVGRGDRDALLTAIAKARAWVSDIAEGRVASFAEIADREGKVERHIRLLAALAFVSPEKIVGILSGGARPRGITDLAKSLVYSWRRQALSPPAN
jgi:hypothetical protein